MVRPGLGWLGIQRAFAAAICVAALTSGAVAYGARLGSPRQKNLAEDTHFGTYYVPRIFASGNSLVAMWRSPGLNGSQRSFAISKDGGKTFGPTKIVRPPLITQLYDVESDAAGNIYFAGLTPLANQLAIVRTDLKLKTFTPGVIIEADQNIVDVDIEFASDGRLFAVYQTSFAVFTNGGQITQGQQTWWSVSADQGATFSEVLATNTRPSLDADQFPSLVPGPNGAMWLLREREDTRARAESTVEYTDGHLLASRIDGDPVDPIEISRGAVHPTKPTQVEGFVAADGALCIAWSEHTVGDTSPIQRIYLTRFVVGSPSPEPSSPLVQVGVPHEFHLHRTESGQVVLLVHGAGLDSDEREPNLIGLVSVDDGVSFGPIAQVTGYPPLTSVDATTDGRKVYGLWTDTRVVRFSAFVPRS